jgi:hypothetical protein
MVWLSRIGRGDGMMTVEEAITELHRDLQEVEEWNKFSLEQAMRGLEDDNVPEYTEADLI